MKDKSKFVLGEVVVSFRLLKPHEREYFDEFLEQKHYLKSARLGGRSLRYVAEFNRQWIALISFSGAAPNLKSRRQWIGWSPQQRLRRLGFVVNASSLRHGGIISTP